MPDGGDRVPWACAGVFVATLIAYWPMLHGSFIWDDDAHVTKPVLRSLHGLWRIWFEVGATQQYYPVLHSAFWLEHRLWGDATLGYHLTNVFLHATAACLFGLILRRFWKRDDAAWLAAFLFALHPVGVESVAWISEQKNTLSVVFYLASAMTHLRWRETLVVKQVGLGGRARPLAPSALGVSPNERSGATAQPYLYFVALGLFVLALLSKSVTATLPAALLVVLWWQHGRLSWKRDILPLLPWFAIGAIAGVFTAWVERKYIGAEGAAFTLSFLQRCLLAGRVAWFYLAKLVWPANLIFVYPHWTVDPAAGWQYLFPLGAVVLLAALWLLRRRTRGPLAGALFFLGTLFPALGFFNVYPFLFSYVADHFQYLASLGIIALAAAGWARWTQGAMAEDAAGRPRGMPGSLLVAIPVLCLLGGLTWRQSRLYRDPQILYRATLERNPGAWLADTSLGVILADDHRLPEAVADYEQALRLNPDYALGHYDLGNALAQLGRLPEAIAQYSAALKLQPSSPPTHLNLGNTLYEMGNFPGAIAQYEEAVRLSPDSAENQLNLGRALARSGRLPEALSAYEASLRLDPDYADAHFNFGNALANLGRMEEATAQYGEALRLKPDYPEAQNNLGAALMRLGRFPEAIAAYERALQLRGDYPQAEYNLSLALRATGRVGEANTHLARAQYLQAQHRP
jgi:tetratricopeptide (TPR) repeat protein